MSLLAVGVSHRSAPVEMLERVALDDDAVTKVLDEAAGSAQLSETVVIATCNRLELYADVATFHGGVDEAAAIIAARTGVPLDDLTPHLYVQYDQRAVAHLFQVVCGLDSMVVGESQILGQVREAFRLAQTSGSTGRVLGEVFQTALRVGKRAHAETDIDRAGRSLVTVGLAAVAPALGHSLTGKAAAVIGAGSMAALAATTLAREGAEVTVVNRTFERGRRLAESVGGRAAAMAELPTVLDDADLVVSCTGAAGVVLPLEMLEAAVDRRAGRTLGIVDLALPHDVDPSAAKLPGVTLADLATLAAGEAPDGGPLTGDVEAVRAIVDDEVAAFASARRAATVAPTVVALRAMADDVVAAELTRMSGRLPGLDERTRAEVAATVRRVVEKLLHSPTVRVKELAAHPDGATYETALRELFALDPAAIDAIARPDGSQP